MGALGPAEPRWKFTNYTYPTPGAARPHAVTGLSTGESYGYDANRNMTSRTEGGVSYTQNFDAENCLASVLVNNQTTAFVYDGEGTMVKKTRPDSTYPIYIGGPTKLSSAPAA